MIKNKKFYREKYQALRMKLLKEEIYDLSDKIVSILKTIPVWEKNTYHLFISSKQKNEVETKKILSYLYDLGKKTWQYYTHVIDTIISEFAKKHRPKTMTDFKDIPDPRLLLLK